ncbi:13208_t:CDS:1 [Dentiscutata erythropus]|uniref:13208_t:CDS:1 n=1 Tax=Dentiscutata erythropus TaxID=1348616 RepID=A0A9N9IU87_9GLOM|nr:13208_t:CDS:1 [Dentiscutata erythropus]
MQMQFLVIFLIFLLFLNDVGAQVTRKGYISHRRVGKPRSRKNSSSVVVPRPKGPCYARTPVLAQPNTVIDKLVTWNRGRYRDILNQNGRVTNQYKGGIYVERIGSNSQVHYSPVYKLPEITPRSRNEF